MDRTNLTRRRPARVAEAFEIPAVPPRIVFQQEALHDIQERDAEWERDRDQWNRDGYRAHYCRHGVNLWVDYDCACGACEESLSPLEEAVAVGRSNWNTAMVRRRAAIARALLQDPTMLDAMTADLPSLTGSATGGQTTTMLFAAIRRHPADR
ncbi:hypothetical protein D3C74_257290 [compost metagenome]